MHEQRSLGSCSVVPIWFNIVAARFSPGRSSSSGYFFPVHGDGCFCSELPSFGRMIVLLNKQSFYQLFSWMTPTT